MDKAFLAPSVSGLDGSGKEGSQHAEEKREDDGGNQAAGEDHALLAGAENDLAAARFLRGVRRLRWRWLGWCFANHNEKSGSQPAKFYGEDRFVT